MAADEVRLGPDRHLPWQVPADDWLTKIVASRLVLEVDAEVGEDRLSLDEVPNDPSRVVPVERYDGPHSLDSCPAVARMRVYLAGPDVFFPDPLAWAARKSTICVAHGLEPVTPFDAVPEPPAWARLPEADRIARRNEAHIRACTAVIANLTPFRGASADAGTIYEVGFARGLGLRVFGYSTVTMLLAARSRAVAGGAGLTDGDGFTIEDFGLSDNLMIDCAVREAGVLVVQDEDWWDLSAFTACVAAAALSLAGSIPGPL